MSTREEVALDVWLKIPEGEEESEYEANTYKEPDGEYRVEWYHTAVGQVSSKWFPTYAAACEWLRANGFEDFTS